MCDYQGHEFGASYLDSVCIDGQLYDADNCDDHGNLYEPLTYIPCPQCNHVAWLEEQKEYIQEAGYRAAEEDLARVTPYKAEKLRYPRDFNQLVSWWFEGIDTCIKEKNDAL